MAVTDLTNTTWTFKPTCNAYVSDSTHAWAVNYTTDATSDTELSNITSPARGANNEQVASIVLVSSNLSVAVYYLKTTDAGYTSGGLTEGEGWYLYTVSSQTYTKLSGLTINIVDGAQVTDTDLITWLEANATQPGTEPDDKELVTYEDLVAFKEQMVAFIMQYKCGYYDNNAWYNVGDTVFYQKQIYICKSNTLGGVVPTNTTYWMPLIVNS